MEVGFYKGYLQPVSEFYEEDSNYIEEGCLRSFVKEVAIDFANDNHEIDNAELDAINEIEFVLSVSYVVK